MSETIRIDLGHQMEVSTVKTKRHLPGTLSKGLLGMFSQKRRSTNVESLCVSRVRNRPGRRYPG